MFASKKLLAAFLIVLQPNLFGLSPVSVPVMSNGQENTVSADGFAVTAQLILPAEYKKHFSRLPGATKGNEYIDLNAQHIYPVAVSMINNTDRAIVLTMPQPSIANAQILTAAKLQRLIGFTEAVGVGSLFLFFPLFFVFIYNAVQLEELVPLITQHGLNSDEITVQPQETYQTVLFVQLFHTRKDGGKKLEKPILPTQFDILIPLGN